MASSFFEEVLDALVDLDVGWKHTRTGDAEITFPGSTQPGEEGPDRIFIVTEKGTMAVIQRGYEEIVRVVLDADRAPEDVASDLDRELRDWVAPLQAPAVPRTPSSGASDADVKAAIRRVVAWVSSLADLPPPGPKDKDDVGFSGVTNSPLRTYLAQVQTLGPDQLPIDVHFAAVSYLREHSRTQLNREEWEKAFAVLKRAWTAKLGGIDQRYGSKGQEAAQKYGETTSSESADAQELATETKRTRETTSPEEKAVRTMLRVHGNANAGEAGRDGTWQFKDGWVILQPGFRRKYGLKSAMLQAQGLRSNVDFRWVKVGETWFLHVHPQAAARMADLMEGGWPLLAAAMRAYLPEWVQLAGPREEGAVNEGPPFTGTPEAGQTKSGLRWKWNPSDPDNLELLIPKGLSQTLSVASRFNPVDVNGKKEWWIAYQMEQLDDLIEQLRAARAGALADALEQFAPTWRAGPAIDDESARRAHNLGKRFKYMMHPEVRQNEEAVESALARVAGLLHKVKPGDTSCNLGSYGSWEVVPEQAGGPIDDKASLRIYMPYALRAWSEGLRHAKKRQGPKGWYDSVPLKRAPEAARRLDLFSPALALSIRIALLTEVLRECPELEELAGTTSVADIADPAVRAQTEAILRKVYQGLAPGFKLYPYQEVGVAFVVFSGYRALIGDSMGLGKTPTTLATLAYDPARLTPALVVAPASVVHNWKREGERWTPGLDFQVIDGSTRLNSLGEGDVAIVSWGAVTNLFERLQQAEFKTIIIDESHYGKNPKAARTKSVIELGASTPHRLLLSGTAMENRPEELWSQLHIVAPEVFVDAKEFKTKFGSTTKRRVRDIDFFDDRGADGPDLVLAELRETLRCFMVRRLKSEVLTDLPEKTRSYLWGPLPSALQNKYEQIAENMEAWLCSLWFAKALKKAVELVHTGMTPADAAGEVNAEAKDISAAAQMAIVVLGHLRRLVGEAKAEMAVDWLESYFSQSDEPIVVFVEHQKPLKIIQDGLDKLGITWTYIDGSVPPAQRAKRVAEFQNGDYQVFLGTRAMAEGVTLTRASNVLFVERWWVPSKEEQAEDRTHRIGQLNAVMVRYLMASDTVDVHIHELVDAKRVLIQAVLRGEAIEENDRTAESRGDGSKSLVAQMLNRMLVNAGNCWITPQNVQDALRGHYPAIVPPPKVSGDSDEIEGPVEIPEGHVRWERPIEADYENLRARFLQEHPQWAAAFDSHRSAILALMRKLREER